MEDTEVDMLVKQLTSGFEVLQDEYQKLFGQYQSLERKLATAREQYNELSKLCDSGSVTTPPLSLTSSPGQRHTETSQLTAVPTILEQRPDSSSQSAARLVQQATQAADLLRSGIKPVASATGVRIWSGPSADRVERGSSMMPSISESPLEQDFTVEGKPSKLGCPFASMAGKKLSSHAASVLSRLNPGGSTPGSPTNADAMSSARGSVSRVNGRESLARRSCADRRTSFADPIKAEICGMDSHLQTDVQTEDRESPMSERAAFKSHVSQQQQEAGVCPIRFLDQHSPEEVATYFERHKHELPRSHEICVKRYQSNEKQIRELDAKYGNLVSMIQGLGEKHQNLLPKDVDDAIDDNVRKWASSISAQPGQVGGVDEDERASHVDRPLRDIRVGESPTRPWGISVPVDYLENAATRSQGSSSPVKVRQPIIPDPSTRAKPAQCPFGFDKADATPENVKSDGKAEMQDDLPISGDAKVQKEPSSRMVLTGPVFIGYSAADAAQILRESGLGGSR